MNGNNILIHVIESGVHIHKKVGREVEKGIGIEVGKGMGIKVGKEVKTEEVKQMAGKVDRIIIREMSKDLTGDI